MNRADQFNEALASDQPLWRLREVVRALLAQGHDRKVLTDELEQFRAVLRAAGRAEDEDVVLEVMDFLTGWSSPHMKL